MSSPKPSQGPLLAPALEPMIFSQNPLNRAGHERNNPEWLTEQAHRPEALFVPVWHLNPLILPALEPTQGRDVGWLPRSAMGPELAQWPVVFLGINRRNKPLFAVDVSSLADPEHQGPFANMGQFEDIRGLAAGEDMSAGDLAILAQARALIDWHARHPFCAQCGGETIAADAGYKRICLQCQAEHFPRTDPVVIMLAIDGDRCLLGRQAGWPATMYSALAGFIEPGETLEEAVAREMVEEAGIRVSEVRYMGCQPWPFPASLMIGCVATAETTEIINDAQELEDARWISREEARAALAGTGEISAPPPMAIAHHLLRYFVDME